MTAVLAPPKSYPIPDMPELCYMPTDNLFVDRRAYQRGLNEIKVAKIVKAFDPAKVGTISVNLRDDGRGAIYDGAHLCEVLIRQGATEVPCAVTRLSVIKEAMLFATQDTNKKKVTEFEKHRARLYAFEQAVARSESPPEEAVLAKDLDEIVKTAGFKLIGSGGNAAKTQSIRAVAKLYWIHSGYSGMGPDVLRRALVLNRKLWWDKDWNVDGAWLSGLAEFVHSYGDKLTPQGESKLATWLPKQFVQTSLGPVSTGSGGSANRYPIALKLRKVAEIRRSVRNAPWDNDKNDPDKRR